MNQVLLPSFLKNRKVQRFRNGAFPKQQSAFSVAQRKLHYWKNPVKGINRSACLIKSILVKSIIIHCPIDVSLELQKNAKYW